MSASVRSAHGKWLHEDAQHWLILSENLRFGGGEPLRQGVSRAGSRAHHKGGTELGHFDKYEVESKPTQNDDFCALTPRAELPTLGHGREDICAMWRSSYLLFSLLPACPFLFYASFVLCISMRTHYSLYHL